MKVGSGTQHQPASTPSHLIVLDSCVSHWQLRGEILRHTSRELFFVVCFLNLHEKCACKRPLSAEQRLNLTETLLQDWSHQYSPSQWSHRMGPEEVIQSHIHALTQGEFVEWEIFTFA